MTTEVPYFTESTVEDAAFTWFGEPGYNVANGSALPRGAPAAERRLNPAIPENAREEVLRKMLRVATPSLAQTNRAVHRMLCDGIDHMVVNRTQFRTLAALRDTLLPKLLGGELRAPGATKYVEAAV